MSLNQHINCFDYKIRKANQIYNLSLIIPHYLLQILWVHRDIFFILPATSNKYNPLSSQQLANISTIISETMIIYTPNITLLLPNLNSFKHHSALLITNTAFNTIKLWSKQCLFQLDKIFSNFNRATVHVLQNV